MASNGLGRMDPHVAAVLDSVALFIGGAPVVSIPIAICLFLWLTYGLSIFLRLTYRNAALSAMIGASNPFDAAIDTATMLFVFPEVSIQSDPV
jgi:ACR3 family arsenite efflux pump ArsB